MTMDLRLSIYSFLIILKIMFAIKINRNKSRQLKIIWIHIQVPDPRNRNWIPYTGGHERWWDAIWKEAEKRGDEEVTVTTEFGPPNYQVRNDRF